MHLSFVTDCKNLSPVHCGEPPQQSPLPGSFPRASHSKFAKPLRAMTIDDPNRPFEALAVPPPSSQNVSDIASA